MVGSLRSPWSWAAVLRGGAFRMGLDHKGLDLVNGSIHGWIHSLVGLGRDSYKSECPLCLAAPPARGHSAWPQAQKQWSQWRQAEPWAQRNQSSCKSQKGLGTAVECGPNTGHETVLFSNSHVLGKWITSRMSNCLPQDYLLIVGKRVNPGMLYHQATAPVLFILYFVTGPC